MPLKAVRLRVGPEEAGRTLASLLHEAAAVSHATARGLALGGLVTVDGLRASDPARRLRRGELLEASVDPGARRAGRRRPEAPSGFRVVHEDDDLIVVDKEAGLLTVPARDAVEDSLVGRLLALQAARGVRKPRLWAVHRLDRFTSGLVMFARSRMAAGALIDQFTRRTASREYVAVCEGIPPRREGRIASLLEEHPRSHRVRATTDKRRGRPASCTYRVEQRLAGAALLRVLLETGRHNQIRVQFASIGHPLVGDRTYGRESPLIGRVALHAARLGVVHPRSGRPITFESPEPPDLARLLRRLRGARPGPARAGGPS